MKNIFTRYANPLQKKSNLKIAIYGDSFADPTNDYGNPAFISWSKHLDKDFHITNYATGGSSLAYSYELFLQHNMKYDVNIVFVTAYGRLWVPNLQTEYPGVTGLRAVEYRLATCTNASDLVILRAIRDYYLYVEYQPHAQLMHKAMVKDLQMHSNTILIPCFDSKISLVEGTDTYMNQISQIDLDYYGLQRLDLDKRSCHMNEDNNRIFANKMKKYILSDRTEPFRIDLNDYVQPVGEPYDKYFYY